MNVADPEVRPRRARHPAARWLIRSLCNSNPFYAISAVLVLLGLRASYDPEAESVSTWASLSGLAAYTMLLAGMACYLVRRGGVWEDVRTLVLLVAMVLLAIPTFFDDVIARDPRLGAACELAGLLFAVAISEALLRGLKIRFPIGFRVPYHLTLGLCYLHPIALVPLLKDPGAPALMWALFAFPVAAGLVALTLLPAARRGPEYVAKNGSPWRWPYYPWSLFTLMSVVVCVRAYSLCLSVNYSGGTAGYEGIGQTIFGPYFLVPFGLGLAVVALELGIVARNRAAMTAALALPMVLVVLSAVGHRPDAAYQRFLRLFAEGTGGTPLFLALAAAMGFYAVAALRRVPAAADALAVAMTAIAFIGPETLDFDGLTAPHAAPLLAVAALYGALAVVQSSSWRAILATAGLAAATTIGPFGGWASPARGIAGAHVALAGALLIGALFRDGLARAVRVLGASALAVAALAPMWGPASLPPIEVPPAYPIVPILTAAIYGHFVGGPIFLAAATAGLAGWMLVSGGRGYAALRRSVVGLDQIALGLLSFALAAGISLLKAGPRPGRDPEPLSDTPSPDVAAQVNVPGSPTM